MFGFGERPKKKYIKFTDLLTKNSINFENHREFVEIFGDVNINEPCITDLPRLKVNGDFRLSQVDFPEVPDGTEVYGEFSLKASSAKRIGDNFVCTGEVYLLGSAVEEIGSMDVWGLNLDHSAVRKLGGGYVRDCLSLNSFVTEVPDDLSCGRII